MVEDQMTSLGSMSMTYGNPVSANRKKNTEEHRHYSGTWWLRASKGQDRSAKRPPIPECVEQQGASTETRGCFLQEFGVSSLFWGGISNRIEHHLLWRRHEATLMHFRRSHFSAFDDSNLLFLLTLDRLLMNPATGFSTLPGTCIHTKWIEDERIPPYPKISQSRRPGDKIQRPLQNLGGLQPRSRVCWIQFCLSEGKKELKELDKRFSLHWQKWSKMDLKTLFFKCGWTWCIYVFGP